MTRPLHSRQLDGIASILAQVSAALDPDGTGRTSLAVMRDHADAHGFPTNTMGGRSTSSGPPLSSTERAAVLDHDPTLADYEHQVADLLRLGALARKVLDRHRRYSPDRNVTVCSSCAEELPRGRVRCPSCGLHPDTRVCRNVTCQEVLGTDDHGNHGWCDACRKFLSRKGRLPAAEDVARRTTRRERQRA